MKVYPKTTNKSANLNLFDSDLSLIISTIQAQIGIC